MNIEKAIKRDAKARAKRIKHRNKKLGKHGIQFVRWVKHHDGTRTMVLKKVNA